MNPPFSTLRAVLKYMRTDDQDATALPGVGCYSKPNYLVPGLVVMGDRPTASELRDSLRYPNHDGHLIWYPPRLSRHADVRRGDDGRSWWIVGTAQSLWEVFQRRQAATLLRA